MGPHPGSGLAQPVGQHIDIEDVVPIQLLLFGQKVEKKCGQVSLLQRPRDINIARTQMAAAAAMRK